MSFAPTLSSCSSWGFIRLSLKTVFFLLVLLGLNICFQTCFADVNLPLWVPCGVEGESAPVLGAGIGPCFLGFPDVRINQSPLLLFTGA